MPSALPSEVLEALRRHSTPTICNAIEEFDVRPRSAGFMGPGVRCVFPERAPTVGYAATARIRAGAPHAPAGGPRRADFWDYVLSVPPPRFVVMQDLDPTPLGSYWGEVQASIHRALGCVGVVTDGGVRDVEEVAALGFQMFASCLLVSHAYVHLVDFGQPVRVAGLEVASGDLLHGDRHGVTGVPAEVAPEIDAAARRVAEREQRIFDVCRADALDLPRLKELLG